MNRSADLDDDLRERLLRETILRGVCYFPALESTNSWALAHAFDTPQTLPLLVWARHQEKGRGRGSNQWHSGDGALTFSIALRSQQATGSPEERPKLALLAGLAVREAVADLLPQEDVRVKWPNDVYVNGRKIGGILVETPHTQAADAVIGIGVNVANSLHNAPPEVRHRGISLIDLLPPGSPQANTPTANSLPDLTEVLVQLLLAFGKQWQAFESGKWDLCQQWRGICYLTGRQIDVQVGPRRQQGRVRGIAADGALQLELRNGQIQSIYAGHVTVID